MATDRIACKADIERMLEGCDEAQRTRVLHGALTDLDKQLRDLRLRNAQLTRWRMELADRMGYPSGYGVD